MGAPTLLALLVAPSSATLEAGACADFTVGGSWSDASTTVPDVAWTATGGTVSSTGEYCSDDEPGEFHVVATHSPSERADTAAVTVVEPDPTVTVLLTEGFEDNAAGSRGWYDNTTWTTTIDEHRSTGERSLAWHWAQGATLPAFGAASRHLFTPTEQVYVAYWVKYSSNWIGSGENYHPHEITLLTTANAEFTGPAFSRLTAYIEHLYTAGGGVPKIGITDAMNIDNSQIGQNLSAVTENRSVAGCNGNTDGLPTDCYSIGSGLHSNGKWLYPPGSAPAFLPNAGPGYKGDWHRVEVLFRLNSVVGGVGIANGIAQYWFDGQLLIDRREVLFRTGAHPDMRFNQILLAPYIGDGSPVAQTSWLDDLIVATGRPISP